MGFADPLDTTVRLKFNLKAHPDLTTPAAVAKKMAAFGQTDTDSIVLSLKPPKKAANNPAKLGTALVAFKQIGDAFAEVCASGRTDRGLDGIEVGWVGGKEPPILVWLKKLGKLGTPPATTPVTRGAEAGGEKAQLPQTQTTANASSFSSFPSSFVRLFCFTGSLGSSLTLSRQPDIPVHSTDSEVPSAGIDYESLTLMRLRQAERERLERDIREQEAKD